MNFNDFMKMPANEAKKAFEGGVEQGSGNRKKGPTPDMEKCCEKCFGRIEMGPSVRVGCLNPDCPCHSSPAMEEKKCWCGYQEWMDGGHGPACPMFTPATTEKGIKVVPSPRQDYCCACDKVHGYDCPKDTEKWEEEFDALIESLPSKYVGATPKEVVKSFIKGLLANQKAALVETLEGMIEEVPSVDDDSIHPIVVNTQNATIKSVLALLRREEK